MVTAWLGFVAAPVLAGVAFAYAWSRRGVASRWGAWPAVAACLAMPFVLPPVWTTVQVIVSVIAVTTAAKAHMAAHGGPRDPAMAANVGRFALWWIMPPESTWPADPTATARARARGLRRAVRVAAKLPVFGALYLVHAWVPELHAHRVVEAFWALWLCWLGVSAIADGVTAVVMQFGVDFEEIFEAPPLARSPRDFWGRRWNLFVHRFASRFLFLPLGGRRHPARAMFAVFLCSGLMHEYFVFACTGARGTHAGWMMGFFALHGAAVVGEMALRRRRKRPLPGALAVALHIGWLTVTGPLFFGPMGEVFAGW